MGDTSSSIPVQGAIDFPKLVPFISTALRAPSPLKRTCLAYLVEGHPRNISVKVFENWSIGLGVDII